ncbi:MAG: hypothetical protein U5L00_00285 [Desulfovermiculus sp.]|nr:hypothetical protein [Desulfovermiculus sp.]
MAKAIRHILLGMGHLFDLSGCFEKSAMKQAKRKAQETAKGHE